jgi:hypothetical protein
MEATGTTWRGGSVVQPAISPLSKLLDLPLNCRKHSTSQFLIDNFERSLAFNPPKQSDACPPWRAQASELPTISNCQSPELEISLSHRKQRTENFLIAKSRPMLPSLNQHLSREMGPRWQRIPDSRLSTLNRELPSLIANEPHSREESCACKQTTYKILIANEFYSQDASCHPLFHHSGEAMTTFVADYPWQCDNCAGISERGRRRSSLSVWGNETWL